MTVTARVPKGSTRPYVRRDWYHHIIVYGYLVYNSQDQAIQTPGVGSRAKLVTYRASRFTCEG